MTTENQDTWYHRLVTLEPAVIRGLLVSVFAVLALFGVEFATEENALTIVNAIVAVLPLLAGVFIRGAVTPVAKTAAREGEHGGFVAEDAAPYPNETPVDVLPEENTPRTREAEEDYTGAPQTDEGPLPDDER